MNGAEVTDALNNYYALLDKLERGEVALRRGGCRRVQIENTVYACTQNDLDELETKARETDGHSNEWQDLLDAFETSHRVVCTFDAGYNY